MFHNSTIADNINNIPSNPSLQEMIIVSGGIINTGVSDGTNTYSRGCASF